MCSCEMQSTWEQGPGSRDVLLFDCELLTPPLMTNYTPPSLLLSLTKYVLHNWCSICPGCPPPIVCLTVCVCVSLSGARDIYSVKCENCLCAGANNRCDAHSEVLTLSAFSLCCSLFVSCSTTNCLLLADTHWKLVFRPPDVSNYM